MMLAPVRISAPAATPVTLSEVKANSRLDHMDEDPLLNGLIASAVSYLDGPVGILGRNVMVPQGWQQDYPGFTEIVRLPLGPLIDVVEVKYFDAGNQMQTLAPSVYGSWTDAQGPYVALKPDQSWPATYRRADAVRIVWNAGYASVPAAIKQAMLLLIGHWYENREATVAGNYGQQTVPLAFDSLIAPFRSWSSHGL